MRLQCYIFLWSFVLYCFEENCYVAEFPRSYHKKGNWKVEKVKKWIRGDMSKKMKNFTISLEYVEKNDFFRHIEFIEFKQENLRLLGGG